MWRTLGVMTVLACVLTSWATMNVPRDIPYRKERTATTQNQHAAKTSNSSHTAPEGGNIGLQTATNKMRARSYTYIAGSKGTSHSYYSPISNLSPFAPKVLLLLLFIGTTTHLLWRIFLLMLRTSLFFFFTDPLQHQIFLYLFSFHLYFTCWLKHKIS